MNSGPITIHHAPWSRRFRTHWVKGAYAYELQVGCLVAQFFYERPEHHHRLHFWRSWYSNPKRVKYLRSALWGSNLPEYY